MEIEFFVIGNAVLKMLILIFVGSLLYGLKVMKDELLDGLTMLLIKILFPALIFIKTVTYFDFNEFSHWWVMPLCGIAYSLIGISMGYLINKFIVKSPNTKEFPCVVGFQNGGYLVLTLLLFLGTSDATKNIMIVNVFMFLVGFNVLVWTLLPMMLKLTEKDPKLHLKFIANPPVIATVISLVWVAVFGKNHVPELIYDPLSQIANISYPVAMITLGGYLCKFSGHIPDDKKGLLSGLFLKLLLFPVIVLAILVKIPNIPQEIRFVLFLESIMPTAVSLIAISRMTDTNSKFFTSVIFYSHLAAIITLPIWLQIYSNIF